MSPWVFLQMVQGLSMQNCSIRTTEQKSPLQVDAGVTCPISHDQSKFGFCLVGLGQLITDVSVQALTDTKENKLTALQKAVA